MVIVRPADPADALAMAQLRAASIRQLCRADHDDDPAAIADWVGPPDKFVLLMQRSDVVLVVAEIDQVLAGLAGLSADMITLNYVHPDFRFRGVSKALMQALESRLVADGMETGRLNSTVTALPFYRGLGWVEVGPGTKATGHPMTKRLI